MLWSKARVLWHVLVKKLQICKSEVVPSQRFFFNDFITVLQARESCREEHEIEAFGVLKGTFCFLCVSSCFSWKSHVDGHPIRNNVGTHVCAWGAVTRTTLQMTSQGITFMFVWLFSHTKEKKMFSFIKCTTICIYAFTNVYDIHISYKLCKFIYCDSINI